MKKILFFLAFLASLSGFGQAITTTVPTQPRVVTKNIVVDTLWGSRYGSGVLSDSIIIPGGFLFQDGSYLFSATVVPDTTVIATKAYVDHEIDSLGALIPDEALYPDSSVLFVGSDGRPTTDSLRFLINPNTTNPSIRIGQRAFYATNPTFSSFTSFGANSGISSHMNSNTPNTTAIFSMYKSRGTEAAPTQTLADDRLGSINFLSYNGSTFGTGARIRAYAKDNAFGTSPNSYMTFEISSGPESLISVFMFSNGVSINGSKFDTAYALSVNGTTRITETPFGGLTDSIALIDDTTGQIKAWRPVRLFAQKGDSNSFLSLNVTGTILASSEIQGNYFKTSSPSNGLILSTNGRLKAPDGNGIWEITNNTENGFNRLNLGDNTSSFPSIKVFGNDIHIRLADDSDSTGIVADTVTCSVLNAGTIVGISSGTYTPTDSALVNIDAIVVNNAVFTRVGNTVTVGGTIEIDATVTATPTSFFISIPSGMNLPGVGGGTFNALGAKEGGGIFVDTSSRRVAFQFLPTSIVSQNYTYSFTFNVQ